MLSDLVEYLFDGEIWYECFATVYIMAASLASHRPAFQAVAERIERFVEGHSEKGYVWLTQMILAFRLRQASQQGKVRDAHVLMKDKFLQDVKSGALSRGDCRWRLWNLAIGGLVRGEVLLGHLDSAVSLVDQFGQAVTDSDHVMAQIELYLLQALVAQEQGEQQLALSHLERALTMPVSTLYAQLFVNEAQLLAPTVARAMESGGLRLLPTEYEVLRAMQAAAQSVPLSSAEDTYHASSMARAGAARKPASLSERETTVLRLIWNGMSSKEIGLYLQLSESTVKIYRKRLYAKLGVNSRSEAIAAGRRMEILKDSAGITASTAGRRAVP
jgi:DNA-binding CsgD family transcriptional regulator